MSASAVSATALIADQHLELAGLDALSYTASASSAGPARTSPVRDVEARAVAVADDSLPVEVALRERALLVRCRRRRTPPTNRRRASERDLGAVDPDSAELGEPGEGPTLVQPLTREV